jgi:hypothetical protein
MSTSKNSDILGRVKLLMNYDPKLTLNENKSSINEQISMYNPAWGQQAAEDIARQEKDENKWRNVCKYPDKAILPVNTSFGVEGKDALIAGYCFYPIPKIKSVNGGETEGMFIPQDAEINWYDENGLSRIVDKLYKENSSKVKQDYDTMYKNLKMIIPLGTVGVFKYNDQTSNTLQKYNPWVQFNSERQMWIFLGYFREGDNKAYVQPMWEDTRNKLQKFIDDWGTATQILAALGMALVGYFTGGAAWIFWAEIAVEGLLGITVSAREFQKNNTIGGLFELVFGLTPLLKTWPFFRGINKEVADKLVDELKRSNLTLQSTPEEIFRWYESVADEKVKQLFSKMLKSGDELSVDKLKEYLDVASKEFKTFLRQNPQKLKEIKILNNLWVKEGLVNGSLLFLSFMYDTIFDEPLTNEEKNKLKGILLKLPEGIHKDFIKQAEENNAIIKEFRPVIQKISQKFDNPKIYKIISNRIDSVQKIALSAKILKDTIPSYKIPKDIIPETEKIPKGFTKLEFDKAIEEFSKNNIDSFFQKNDIIYYRIKKK